jgi:hypothetical protein
MSQEKFTISEIKKYITSQDSLGDVLYNLTADNIVKANIEDPIVIYKKWLMGEFESITEEYTNSETMLDVTIENEDENIIITFSVDANRSGIQPHNTIYIYKQLGYSVVKVRLCELLEGFGIEEDLSVSIQNNIKQLLELDLTNE